MARALADRATPSGEVAPAWRPRKHLWAAMGLFFAGSLALTGIADWRESHALLINQTTSLPNWAFVIHKTHVPRRGDYVFFVPPQHPIVVRHFGPTKQMFGKIVYGMPGDTVEHRGDQVLVAGRVVSHTKPETRFGEPLVPGADGIVPRGCYYVGTPHKDGFDSRYAAIGYACADKIVGVGEPIL